MKEIELRDDIYIGYFEIQDGEAISIQSETDEGITDQIILIRPVALEIAKIILEMMGNDEKTTTEEQDAENTGYEEKEEN